MKRKTLKGMTLAEVIIAIAVFAMLGTVLVTTGSVVDKTTRASQRLNKKVNVQAPYAASKNADYIGPKYDDEGNVVLDEHGEIVMEAKTLTDSAMTFDVYFGSSSSNPDKVTVKYQNTDGSTRNVEEEAKVSVGAKKYDTRAIVYDPATGFIDSEVYTEDGPNDGLNLKYAVIQNMITQNLSVEQGKKVQITDDYGYALNDMDTDWEVISDDTGDDNLSDICSVNAKGEISAVATSSTEQHSATIEGSRKGVKYQILVIVPPAVGGGT